MAHVWRGVIEEYREWLPVTDGSPVISLGEGGTPLVRSAWLSGLVRGDVWLKVEGNNPTGSFKDRGMTTAVSVARNRRSNVFGPGESAHAELEVFDIGRARTRYHVSIDVDDRAGVLASVASAFAEFGVSIKTVRQEGSGSDAQLVIVTHEAEDSALSATVASLRGLDMVRDVTSVMRVEGGF